MGNKQMKKNSSQKSPSIEKAKSVPKLAGEVDPLSGTELKTLL